MNNFFSANSISLFALMLMTVILFHTNHYFKLHNINNKNIWRNVLIFAIIAQITDMLANSFNGLQGDFFYVVNIFLRASTFVLVTIFSSSLALFLEYVISSRTQSYYKIKKWLISVIVVAIVLQLISVPFNWVFEINLNNEYVRGPLFIVGLLLMDFPIIIMAYRLLFVHVKKANKLVKSNVKIFSLICFLIAFVVEIVLLQNTSDQIVETTFAIVSLILVSIHLMIMSTSTTIDHLTGLQNTLGVQRYFEGLSKKPKLYVTAIFLDLDKFKETNDTYGHKAGDTLLKDFSKILIMEVKNKDLASRIGGDEFLLVIQTDHIKAVQRLINRIKEEVDEYNKTHKIKIYYSCGHSTNEPGKEVDKQKLINSADKKMYEVKEINHKKMNYK